MKTHTLPFAFLLLSLLLSVKNIEAQNYSYKGMYVYTLDSILNDATGKTQDVLLRYCRDSSINALTLSVGVFNLNTSPSYVTKLASFIKKGRTRYGIKFFSAVFSDYTTLQNEIRFYQNSRTDSMEKFNYYNYEFEYWNNNFYTATGTAETDYCTKYLQPEGYSCDSVGAWNYFKKYIKLVDSLAQVDNIKSSLYIGVKSKDTLKNRFIANTVDLIMIASYKSVPTDLYQTHTTGKFTAFSKANHKVDVIPIFASLTQSATENLKIWLKVPPTGKHAEASAMPYFVSEYNLLPATVKNNINLIGYQWFKYGGMPKDSSFTAITLIPTGLSSTPSSTAATVNWTSISGATQYTVCYAPANSYNWTKLTTSINSGTISGLNPDSPYQFLVYAKTPNGTTASSLIATFSTTANAVVCPQISGLNSSAVSSTSATLSWISVVGASSYTVRYKAVSQTSWTMLAATTNTVSLSTLTSATAYEFQVQTQCGANNSSDFSPSSNFTTDAPSCSIPSALASNLVSTTTASLTWSAVAGALNYTVAYRLGTSSSWITQTSNSNSLNLTGLVPASSYEFQVQTNCSAISSSSFSQISSFLTSNPVCGIPSGITASLITSSGATISWNAVSGASTYILNYRIVSTSIWTSMSCTTAAAVLSNLMPLSTYEYAVQTYCSATNSSAFAATLQFTTSSNCTVPSGVSATANSSTTAAINWSAASNALSYNVEYKLASAGTWTALGSSGVTAALTSLVASSNYSYRLQSVCANSVSAYTAAAQFTTPAAAASCAIPSNVFVSAISSTSATLNWLAVNGVTSYKIQYRKVGTSIWTSKTTNNIYKVMSSLKTSTDYECKVQSICSSNSSSNFSTVINFRTLGSGAKVSATAFALRTSSGISLQWNASDELNGTYYLIEKSEDGIEFEPFRTIVVGSANLQNSTYELFDTDFSIAQQNQSVWYTISQIDADGNSMPLGTVEVLPKVDFEDEFKIYPNPNNGEAINLNVQLNHAEEILVVLIDVLGNTVFSKVVVTDDNGTLATAINPGQDLAKGIYQVVGYSSQKSLSKKLIVK